MSTHHPIKKRQPSDEKIINKPQKQAENKPSPKKEKVHKSEGEPDENFDANLYESMNDDLDRGKGGINRGLGDIGDMQGEDVEEEIEADLEEDFYESNFGKPRDDNDALYDDKVNDINK